MSSRRKSIIQSQIKAIKDAMDHKEALKDIFELSGWEFDNKFIPHLQRVLNQELKLDIELKDLEIVQDLSKLLHDEEGLRTASLKAGLMDYLATKVTDYHEVEQEGDSL